MKKNDLIKLGLIIQGPILTYGQGGNNSINGFDSTNIINENIQNFSPLVEKIVFSTWLDSKFKLSNNFYNNVFIIESPMPCQSDPDNRKKQFYSTFAGIRFLQMNSDVTHVLKIRTDQLIPVTIIKWLFDIFTDKGLKNDFKIENKIVFSEFIKSEYFYVGDFIFAGEINKVLEFININLAYKANLHPSIGVDYFLKYLSVNDSIFFNRLFHNNLPLIIQVSMKKNEIIKNYWLSQLIDKCIFIPRTIANEIIWRGKKMENLNFENFCYFEDWQDLYVKNSNLTITIKSVSFLSIILMEKAVFRKILYEYKRYYLLRFKFTFPRFISIHKKFFKKPFTVKNF